MTGDQRPDGSWPLRKGDSMLILTLKIARATIADLVADPEIAAVVNRDDMKKSVRQALQTLDEEIEANRGGSRCSR